LKRCVGLPGDTVQVINRVLYVSGKPFPLPRNLKFSFSRMMPPDQIDERIFPRGALWNEDNYGPLVIPKEGMIIPLSSRNIQAWDTFIRREGHTVRVLGDEIVVDGRPATEYRVERDYVFGMGDHRDNSLDGRYWGFIPKENLVGTPLIVYWSWDSDIPIYNIFAKLGSVRLGRIGTLIK
jgi:signal peptidase I